MRVLDWFRSRWSKPPDWATDADDLRDPANDGLTAGLPEHVANLVREGSRHFRLGDIESGARCYHQALDAEPTSAAACIAVGRLQLQHAQPSAAEQSFRRALELKPNLPEVHFYLASALGAQGRLQEAAANYQICIRLDPGTPYAYNNLGLIYRSLSRFDEAIRSCQRAVEIDPDFAFAHHNLGLAFWQLGKLDDAMDAIQRAIALDPAQASFHNNMGIVCFEKGEVERAESEFLESLKLAPDFVDPVVNLASTYEATYRLDDAWARIRQGFSIAPEHPQLHLCAARCEVRNGALKKAIKRLEKLPMDDLPSSTRAEVEHELALLYMRDGRHGQAFAHATKANHHTREVATAFGIDKREFLDEIDSVSRWLTRENSRQRASDSGAGTQDTPVFLVGFPRSGTTLLDQIFDSHPQVQTLEEPLSVDAMKVILKNSPEGYPHSMSSLTPDELHRLKSAYFGVVEQRLKREPGTVFIDKLPLNLCNAALIHRVFPGALFLFALRHPCDVCLSAYMQNFRLNSAMACFLDLEDAALLYERLMKLWQQSVEVLSLEYHTIRYEDLVVDMRPQIEAALKFIGVAWDDKVLKHLDHARQRRRIGTPSFRQVTEPMYKTARYRWHHYERELTPVLPRLRPFIERFGY